MLVLVRRICKYGLKMKYRNFKSLIDKFIIDIKIYVLLVMSFIIVYVYIRYIRCEICLFLIVFFYFKVNVNKI